MRNDTNLVSANSAADAQVRTENIAASQGRISDPEVAAAMAEFACEQLRHRTSLGFPFGATTAPHRILRLVE